MGSQLCGQYFQRHPGRNGKAAYELQPSLRNALELYVLQAECHVYAQALIYKEGKCAERVPIPTRRWSQEAHSDAESSSAPQADKRAMLFSS